MVGLSSSYLLNTGQVWYLIGPNVSVCQMVWFSNSGLKTGQKCLFCAISYSFDRWSNIIKLNKMVSICLVFKWSGFRISDSIQNPNNLLTILFLNIKIWMGPVFRSRLYFIKTAEKNRKEDLSFRLFES